MLGRGNTGPVYPWFGKDIRDGIPLAIENYALLHRLWREEVVDWQGKYRTPLQGFTSTPARSTASRRSSGTARSAAPRSPSRRRTTATASSPTTSSGRPATRADGPALPPPVRALRPRQRRPGDRRPRRTGLHAQNSQDAVREFRPYFDNAPVYGHGPSLEEFTSQTPLTVGSPQEVIERTLGFREYAGDYQRQLWLLDHAGLPLKTGSSSSTSSARRSYPSCARSSPPSSRPTCPTPDPRQPSRRGRRHVHGGTVRSPPTEPTLEVTK